MEGKKKRLVFEFTDFCEEPFTDTDLKDVQEHMEDALADFDIQVTSIKVEDVNEP